MCNTIMIYLLLFPLLLLFLKLSIPLKKWAFDFSEMVQLINKIFGHFAKGYC